MYLWFSLVLMFWGGVTSAADTQVINLIISVDWEGYSLDDKNLEAFRKFREDYPEVKIVHFLNAAYFLQSGADAELIQQKINSVIRPGDELGLHIHAFETLLNAADVAYREDYTFWGRANSEPINGVRGHDVPISIFSEVEVRKLIRTSINILEKNGFKNIKSFRAGGWAASPEVLSALVKEGIKIDSSAMPPEIMRNITGEESPLYRNIVNKLWKNTNIQSDNAYEIKTEAGSILEVPNNFALADYISGVAVFKTFKMFINSLDFASGRSVNVHYGFHQETAAEYLGEVRYAIDKMREYIQAYRIEFNSKTFSEIKVNARPALFCENIL